MKLRSAKDCRRRRHSRLRRKISGTADRPRMSVMISNRHMYVQFIDDERGVTLAAACTGRASTGHNVASAQQLGRQAADSAREQGISSVVVDRGGFRYHGRVKAIVESAMEAGLKVGTKEAT